LTGDVTFNGLLRTSLHMRELDELVISMNGRNQFDIDFADAYPEMGQNARDSVYQYYRPCFRLDKEIIQKQDSILGRVLEMFGQYDTCKLVHNNL